MREEENMEIRSEEVQEILGNPPHWMVRYGTGIAIGVLALFLWLSFFIKYPDTISGDIRISFTEPPRHLVAAQSGYIDKVLANNGDEVEEGQTLIVFRGGTANYNHVLHLQDLIRNLPNDADSTLLTFNPNEVLELGELQEDFFNFLEKKSQFARRSEQYTTQGDVLSLEEQRRTLQRRVGYYRNNQESIEQRLEEKQRDKEYKEGLVRDNRLPFSEVQKLEDDIKRLETELQKIEELISDKRIEISMLNTQITRAERGVSENRLTASDALKESFIQLRIRVDEWVRNHVIQSPLDGVVQITGDNISRDQFIVAEEEVMVVVPMRNRQLLGRMELEFSGSGTVKEDQEVIVRLKSYPFPEYGAVIGQVAWKSRVPDQKNKIPVQVIFPNGLVTTTGRNIDPGEELSGDAEIITNEKRFIDRIVDRTRNIGRF
jgi:multidrug resistance efflux pump